MLGSYVEVLSLRLIFSSSKLRGKLLLNFLVFSMLQYTRFLMRIIILLISRSGCLKDIITVKLFDCFVCLVETKFPIRRSELRRANIHMVKLWSYNMSPYSLRFNSTTVLFSHSSEPRYEATDWCFWGSCSVKRICLLSVWLSPSPPLVSGQNFGRGHCRFHVSSLLKILTYLLTPHDICV